MECEMCMISIQKQSCSKHICPIIFQRQMWCNEQRCRGHEKTAPAAWDDVYVLSKCQMGIKIYHENLYTIFLIDWHEFDFFIYYSIVFSVHLIKHDHPKIDKK